MVCEDSGFEVVRELLNEVDIHFIDGKLRIEAHRKLSDEERARLNAHFIAIARIEIVEVGCG